MRRVIYSRLSKPEGSTKYVLEPAGEALFQQFGVGYEEFESGAGNFSTAIIEHDDGRIESVPCEHIKFISETTSEIFPRTYAGLDSLKIR